MHVRKIGIGFFTVLLALVAVVCARANPVPQETIRESIPASVILGNSAEEITLWQGTTGEYHVFLPASAAVSEIVFRINGGGTLTIDGRTLKDGMSCPGLQTEQTYPITYEKEDSQISGQIRFYQSRQNPAVFLRTNSGSMAFVHGNKENEEPGSLRIYDPQGQLAYSGRLDAVKGRGNATWQLEKKPYNLTLVQAADLLDMGTAQNWVLLANAFDPTHLRNKIVYDTASQAGLAYSPDSRWVDLYLNGEYAGLYLLCEKNEIHPERVALEAASAAMISIEKLDRLWAYGSDQFVTEAGIPIRIRHNTGEAELLQRTVQSLERAILSPDGVDPETGKHWHEYIDLDSWAKKYLIEEIFGNLDAGSISQFFYWDTAEGTPRIYAGPVWDYDISMGNPNNWQLDVPEMLYSGRPHLWNPEDTPWFYGLYQKEAFRQRVELLYETQFRPLLEALVSGGMESLAGNITESAAMNRIRWNTEDSAEAVAAMEAYMVRRMAFLDSLWLEGKQYHSVLLYIQEHVMACYAVEHGGYLKEQEVPAGTDTIIYEAWCDAETGERFDFSQPITRDKLIYLKETNLLNQRVEDTGITLRSLVTYVPVAAMGMLLLTVCAFDRLRTSATGKEGAEPEQKKRRRT